MDDSLRREHELAHWKDWQEKAEAVWGWQTPAGQLRAARRAQLFVELGRMSRTSSVLEIGCGTGEFTQRIAPVVGQILATDISPDLLRKAESKLRTVCPTAQASFAIQDAMELKLETSRFDAVFGCSMLHHVNAPRTLSEVYRVLKPGGWAVFSEPNMLNPQIALQKNVPFIKRKLGDSPDETAFFPWQVRRWLRQLGFQHITVRPFDFLHPLTPPKWMSTVAKLGEFLERLPMIRAISGSLIMSGQKPLP